MCVPARILGLQIKSIVIFKKSLQTISGISCLLQKLTINASLVIYLFIHSGYLPFHLYCAINMLYLPVFNLIILLIKIQLSRFCFVGSNSKQILDNSEEQSYLFFRLIQAKERNGSPTPSWVQLLETSYICLFYYIFLATVE